MFGLRVKSLRCAIDCQQRDGVNHALQLRRRACRDGELPGAQIDATFVSKQELDRWTGYFIHEICHAIWTDENAMGGGLQGRT